MKSAIWIYCNEAFILRLKVLFVCFLYISFQLGLHVKDIFVGNTSIGGFAKLTSSLIVFIGCICKKFNVSYCLQICYLPGNRDLIFGLHAVLV